MKHKYLVVDKMSDSDKMDPTQGVTRKHFCSLAFRIELYNITRIKTTLL